MLSTVNSVKEYTGIEASLELIKRAQAIIEIYVGKDEVDIENSSDLILLDKMTAYQTAYMQDNESVVFKQIALNSSTGGDSNVSFDTKLSAPFIAPLAALAAKGLSFNKSRSYRTGKTFQRLHPSSWRSE
jgi:lipopolysaccharide export LptBFGC system permease protein LptF